MRILYAVMQWRRHRRHIWSHISVMFVYGPHFIGRLLKRLVCRCRASFYYAGASDVTARARHLIGGSCPSKRCWNVSALHSTQLTDALLLLRALRSGFCRNISSSWGHMHALSHSMWAESRATVPSSHNNFAIFWVSVQNSLQGDFTQTLQTASLGF